MSPPDSSNERNKLLSRGNGSSVRSDQPCGTSVGHCRRGSGVSVGGTADLGVGDGVGSDAIGVGAVTSGECSGDVSGRGTQEDAQTASNRQRDPNRNGGALSGTHRILDLTTYACLRQMDCTGAVDHHSYPPVSSMAGTIRRVASTASVSWMHVSLLSDTLTPKR